MKWNDRDNWKLIVFGIPLVILAMWANYYLWVLFIRHAAAGK